MLPLLLSLCALATPLPELSLTTAQGEVRTVPDPGGAWVVLELDRSRCRIKRWSRHLAALEQAGGLLLVPAAGVSELNALLELGPRQPSTHVVDPEGRVVLRDVRRRTSQEKIVALVRSRDAHVVWAPAPEVPDWAGAVELSAARTPAGAVLTVDVSPGYHVYGARERSSIPLAVSVEGHPEARARVPAGEKKRLSSGVQRVLHGEVEVPVRVQGEGALGGSVSLQVCTMAACSAPEERGWVAVE